MDHRITTLTILLISGVLLAGCTGQTGQTVFENNTDVTTPRGSDEGPSTEQNMSTPTDTSIMISNETMALNSLRDIYLKENPTTGYTWNATVTSGIKIETDTYVADPVKPGIVGSGGMHHWVIQGIEKGSQTFDAVYKRSWEPLDGSESRYTLNIIVE